MNFEYVISGMTMGTGDLYYNKSALSPYASVFNDKITFMDNKYSNQNISMLFNSHCEPTHGECINELMPSWYNLFADSGGLQLSRTKKGLTPEVKDKIYKHQAQYSDVAMIFDDIPTEFDQSNTGWSMKTSTTGRRFVRDLVKDKAMSTMVNCKRQIEVFDQMGSDAKISLIVQGQDLSSYKEYIETIVGGMTNDELSKCTGISLSSACSGIGFTNRAEMIYAVKEFDIPMELKENIHLLGVGSHEMMIPFFVSPNYFDFVKNVSYDSSTQANSWFFSRYRDKNWNNIDMDSPATTKKSKEVIYETQLVPVFADLYESNKNAFQQFGINDFDFLIQESTKWSDKNIEKKRLYNSDIGFDGSKLLPFFNQMQVVEHFMDWVNKYVEDPTLINSKGLASVSTYEDFMLYWLPLQGKQDKLEEHFSSTLEGFFE